MSGEISEARQRALKREADRLKAREDRKAEAQARRRGSDEQDDPNDPLAEERRIWREKQRAKKAAAGGSPGDEFGEEISHEDQVIIQAKKLQQENAQTLKNTIKVARETAVVGASTIHKLNEQTEQFNRMDNALDETNETLTRSERILRGMKSIGGAFANMFSSSKSKTPKAPLTSSGGGGQAEGLSELEEKDRARQRKKELEEDQQRRDSRASSSASSSSYSSVVGRKAGGPFDSDDMADLTNGRSSTVIPPNAKQSAAIAHLTANQKAEDDALDELSDVLGTLKEQSHVMTAQLNQHSKILDGLGEKVDGTSDRLKKGSRTMAKIS